MICRANVVFALTIDHIRGQSFSSTNRYFTLTIREDSQIEENKETSKSRKYRIAHKKLTETASLFSSTTLPHNTALYPSHRYADRRRHEVRLGEDTPIHSELVYRRRT